MRRYAYAGTLGLTQFTTAAVHGFKFDAAMETEPVASPIPYTEQRKELIPHLAKYTPFGHHVTDAARRFLASDSPRRRTGTWRDW